MKELTPAPAPAQQFTFTHKSPKQAKQPNLPIVLISGVLFFNLLLLGLVLRISANLAESQNQLNRLASFQQELKSGPFFVSNSSELDTDTEECQAALDADMLNHAYLFLTKTITNSSDSTHARIRRMRNDLRAELGQMHQDLKFEVEVLGRVLEDVFKRVADGLVLTVLTGIADQRSEHTLDIVKKEYDSSQRAKLFSDSWGLDDDLVDRLEGLPLSDSEKSLLKSRLKHRERGQRDEWDHSEQAGYLSRQSTPTSRKVRHEVDDALGNLVASMLASQSASAAAANNPLLDPTTQPAPSGVSVVSIALCTFFGLLAGFAGTFAAIRASQPASLKPKDSTSTALAKKEKKVKTTATVAQ